jgi:hypothetical protein
MKKKERKTTNKILLFYCLKNRKELVVSVSFDISAFLIFL